MATLRIGVDADAVEVLRRFDRPVADVARELVAPDRYRRGKIAGGKAANRLRLDRRAFVHRAADFGVPSVNDDEENLVVEFAANDRR